MQGKRLSITGQELAEYARDSGDVKVGMVFDSGSSFFVVTCICTKGKLIMVKGDVICDNGMAVDVRMGIGAMLALWPVKYMESVLDNHIYAAFYREKLGDLLEGN